MRASTVFCTLTLIFLFVGSAQAENCISFIKPESVKVAWTGYKTSAKKAVKGELPAVEILTPKAKTDAELLSNVAFMIDPAKVTSGDAGRDANLRNSFFKFLKNPYIKGYVESADKTSAKIMLSMNGVSKLVPFKVKSDGKKYSAEGEIDVMDFAMQKSVEEFNKVCKDLHKGADGVSKTWSTVSLNISAELSQSCN